MWVGAHWVTACTVTPDGQRVVLASDDRALKVWDLENGRVIASLEGHGGTVRACAVTLDGRRVVSASDDRTLKVWDLETYACLVSHHGDARFLAVAGTATGVVAGDHLGGVWFLDWSPSMAPSCPVTPALRRAAKSPSLWVRLRSWWQPRTS